MSERPWSTTSLQESWVESSSSPLGSRRELETIMLQMEKMRLTTTIGGANEISNYRTTPVSVNLLN
jgi:hypothetical protein